MLGSDFWRNGGATKAGTATWCNGASGRVGVVSASNSLVGSSADDRVSKHLIVLENGSYVVASRHWDNNSIRGSIFEDSVGNGWRTTLGDNNYAVRRSTWDNGGIVDVGAVTILQNTARTRGLLSSANSVLGTAPRGGTYLNVTYVRFLIALWWAALLTTSIPCARFRFSRMALNSRRHCADASDIRSAVP